VARGGSGGAPGLRTNAAGAVDWVGAGAAACAISAGTIPARAVPGRCQNGAEVLWIPIAGPALAEYRDPDNTGEGRTIAILWAGAEIIGAAMTVIGIVGHDVPAYRVQRQASWHLLATASRGARGLALVGSF